MKNSETKKEESSVKRLILLSLMIVLAVVLIIGGCAEEAPAPAPAPAKPTPAPSPGEKQVITPTPSPGPAPKPAPAPEKVYNLKLSSWMGPVGAVNEITDPFWKSIEERSGGRIVIRKYYSASLLGYFDTYRGIQSGIADLSHYVIGINPGIHYLNDFGRMPGMGWESMEMANDIYKELRKKFPEIEKEYEDLKLLYHYFMPANQLHMTKKTVRVPEDLRGTKIIANAIYESVLKDVGCAGIITAFPDWYMSLERGLTEGLITHYPAVEGSGCLEPTKYHTNIGGGGLGMGLSLCFMNMDTFNSLPPDLQQLFLDVGNIERDIMDIDRQAIDRITEESKAKGHEFYDCTPEEIQKWSDLLKPAAEKWIEDCESKGLPARAIYEENMRLVNAYKK